MTDVTEVSNAIGEMSKTFEEFKSTNDERLERLEKGRGETSELTEKLEKIETDLNKLEDINQEITKANEVQKGVADKVDQLETVLSRPSSGYDTKSADTVLKSFEKWCRKGKDALDGAELKVLTVGNPETGGYLAPPEYVREIIKAVTEMSPIRSIARVRQTTQRSVQVPRRSAQFAAVWVAETATRSETTGLTYALEEIATHEASALVDISHADLEDTVFDMEAELTSEFAEQFAKAEGTAFVSGNAVGKAEGIMTNGDVSEVVSGHASTILADGLVSLVHGLKSEYARNATFVLNRTTLGSVRKLKDTAGQYVFQAGMSLQGGLTNTILGHPYIEATDMPSEGSNTYPVAFGDFRRGYMIVDRISMSVLRDPYTQAGSGNVRFNARKRVGGQVILADAIVKQKCST